MYLKITLCSTSSTINRIFSFISLVMIINCCSVLLRASWSCSFSCNFPFRKVVERSCTLSNTVLISVAINLPFWECWSNFVRTADWLIHSWNFFSKSWNSKYLVWKPSAKAPAEISQKEKQNQIPSTSESDFKKLRITYN